MISTLWKLPLLVSTMGRVLGDSVGASYVEQPQDHFDKSNPNTWRQAYWVNDTFWTPGSSAPIFLCVGGEGPPLDSSAVRQSLHCDIAVEWLAEKKALMFAIEHRYYGCHNMSACPVSDLTKPDALRFLSSHQAIEDVANFVRTMNEEHNLKSDQNRWVTWGGSYPGMLAGWSRLKHPELIHAAVASSAPVAAALDMPEYFDHLAFAYSVADNRVGGSAACRDAIRAGHQWIETEFSKGAAGISEVEKRFGQHPGSLGRLEDRINWAGSGVANFPGQENDPLCTEPACNIAKVCTIMTSSELGDEVERLIALRVAQGIVPSKEMESRKPRKSLMPTLREGRSQHLSSLRQKLMLRKQVAQQPDYWLYQTCKEFGFYQTCELGSECMFVRGIMNLSFFTDSCKVYNVSADEVKQNIDATNEFYGGRLPTGPDGKLGSCVLWPNGEVDPWSTLSVLKSPSKEQPTLYVDGASHHSWTWPSRAGDQKSVISARQQIRDTVTDFLSQDCGQGGKSDSSSGSSAPLIIGCIVAIAVAVLAGLYLKRRQQRNDGLLSAQARNPNLSGTSMQGGATR
eukprot:TRINITY_DN112381_c0_g1_i1.p1 TRINITY_DN112381_c0_g1~~TRINITY_DN112381_c0_g1_i1.p1  ORF type:complete len:570 (-),score=105.80 TRINITY_DN112381_c0_g1_i1:156-1865(-)